MQCLQTKARKVYVQTAYDCRKTVEDFVKHKEQRQQTMWLGMYAVARIIFVIKTDIV